MKKSFLFPIFFFLYLPIYAQNPSALIKVENAFEKLCLEKGIRDGFLAYVDSNGIVLTKNGTVNAKQFWNSLPAFDGVFTWSPSYAEMSISGDWGYTTGNYEHRPKTIVDPVDESGQYTTVWHKTPKGEWKYLIDVGNIHPPSPLDKQPKTILIKKYSSGINSRESMADDLEKEFILSLEKNISDAYQKHASIKYILNLTDHQAITSRDSAVILLDKIRPSLKYHPSGIKKSSGKDILAVYGTFGPDSTGGNYLRIWRHEKDGWKIALEVIKI
jgi:hypothetical protein